jgi:hypothetical protein
VLPEAQDVLGSRDALLLEMGDTADLLRAEILGMYRNSDSAFRAACNGSDRHLTCMR